MRIRLLLAAGDRDYEEHLSQVLLDRYEDLFEVQICSTPEQIAELAGKRAFDIALVSPEFAGACSGHPAALTLALLEDGAAGGTAAGIRKYQRISHLVGSLLERYAAVSATAPGGEGGGRVTVAWSPAGGTGKTTAALAYAAQRVAEGKRVLYLNLESFSSSPLYFAESGRSISAVFAKLDGNVEVLLQGLRQQDAGSGIYYFGRPENYDDIHILTEEDQERLLRACARSVDEVVVDTAGGYGQRIRALLETADAILLLTDNTPASWEKLRQFQEQNNLFEAVRERAILVVNKGGRRQNCPLERTVALPWVQAEDPIVVYKTLSARFAGLG